MKFDTSLIVPVGVFLIYIAVVFILREKIPDPQTLLGLLENLYKSYGYWLVFVGALLEGTFPIGFYVPGSQVMLLGAALSRIGVLQFPLVYFVALLGLIIGYMVNYGMGRYGLYHVLARFGFRKAVSAAQKKLVLHGKKAVFIGYIYPSSATLLSTAAGIVKIPFVKFLALSILSQSIWSLIWGGLAYFFGIALITFVLKYFGIVLVFGVVAWVIFKRWKQEPIF